MNNLNVYQETDQHEDVIMQHMGVDFLLDYKNSKMKILSYKYVTSQIINEIVDIAANNGLGKVYCMCREHGLKTFRDCGFSIEGTVSGLYQGENAWYIACFTDHRRKQQNHCDESDKVLAECIDHPRAPLNVVHNANGNIAFRTITSEDMSGNDHINAGTVNTTSWMTLREMDYVARQRNHEVIVAEASENGHVVGSALIDIDLNNHMAELRGCTVTAENKKNGVLPALLDATEKFLEQRKITRILGSTMAQSRELNSMFVRLGYRFCGRLVNHMGVSAGFADMNVWVKYIELSG